MWMNRIWAFAMALVVSGEAHAGGILQIADVKVEGTQVTIPVLLGGDSAGARQAEGGPFGHALELPGTQGRIRGDDDDD